jgi:hypothetical protein
MRVKHADGAWAFGASAPIDNSTPAEADDAGGMLPSACIAGIGC